MDTARQKAQAILADPNFDVEGFVKNINIHYQNKQIVRSLSTHVDIVLGLVQSGDYQFLELQPGFIDPNVFPQMAKEGYEVWHRKQDNGNNRKPSDWYGVVIDDSTCLHFRSLGYRWKCNFDFEVVTGENAAKESRKKWKRLKMSKFGVSPEEKAKNTLPIYQTRKELWQWTENNLGMPACTWRSKRPHHSEFWWTDWSMDKNNRNQWGWNNQATLQFKLLQAGVKHFRLQIDTTQSKVLPFAAADAKESKRRYPQDAMLITKKFSIDEPDLFLKIINYAVKATKDGERFYDRYIKSKLDAELKKAGL